MYALFFPGQECNSEAVLVCINLTLLQRKSCSVHMTASVWIWNCCSSTGYNHLVAKLLHMWRECGKHWWKPMQSTNQPICHPIEQHMWLVLLASQFFFYIGPSIFISMLCSVHLVEYTLSPNSMIKIAPEFCSSPNLAFLWKYLNFNFKPQSMNLALVATYNAITELSSLGTHYCMSTLHCFCLAHRQKWMHTQRIGVILAHDHPTGKHLHIQNSNGRYHHITCRQSITSLNMMLSEWSTFVLMDAHSYIKLMYTSE